MGRNLIGLSGRITFCSVPTTRSNRFKNHIAVLALLSAIDSSYLQCSAVCGCWSCNFVRVRGLLTREVEESRVRVYA